jgi:hypothetical protein
MTLISTITVVIDWNFEACMLWNRSMMIWMAVARNKFHNKPAAGRCQRTEWGRWKLNPTAP